MPVSITTITTSTRRNASISEIITTRTFADRLETLANVREAGIKVCAGGILGMGETTDDRIAMLVTLANLPVPPESVPINMLIPIPGSKLGDAAPVDPDRIRPHHRTCPHPDAEIPCPPLCRAHAR